MLSLSLEKSVRVGRGAGKDEWKTIQLIDEPIRKQRTAVHSMLSDAPRLHSWQTLNRKPWFTFARTIACSRAASEPGASCLPASKLFTCCATRARSRAANVSVLKRARAEVMRKARP